MKLVYCDPDRCINCGLCELACSLQHSRTKDPVSAYHSENMRFNWQESADHPDPADAKEADRPKPLSRCRLQADGINSISISCRHCEISSCILACKNGALYKDETGRVLVDEDKCIGCWMCIMACPYGVITRNVNKQNVPTIESNGVNHHCDLCGDRNTPACVEVCPVRALVYEEQKQNQQQNNQQEQQ